MTRSEALARRSLAFALDPTLSTDQAAARLVLLAGGQTRTLDLARARIQRAAPSGPIAEAAVAALQFASRNTQTEATVRIIVLGRPGAGKGTQCAPLARHLGIPHLSTGDLLRDVSTHETPFGVRVQTYMKTGHLVPDHLVLRLLEERLAQPDATERGFVLDGYPRTIEQAKALDTLLAPSGIDAVIELAVGAETIKERLGLRARLDDTEAAVIRRLEQYDDITVPLLAWYEKRTTLVRVDGDRPTDRVSAELHHQVHAFRRGGTDPALAGNLHRHEPRRTSNGCDHRT
jgi:adenylate kinase